MINRTFDPVIVDEATGGHHGGDFDPTLWLSNPSNIALVNSSGDVNLFQFEREGLYIGHFFYKSRGRAALTAAREMLAFVFSYPEVEVLIGLTPVDKLGAKWLTRKLGFKSYGEVDTIPGRCEMFVLGRNEYKKDQA